MYIRASRLAAAVLTAATVLLSTGPLAAAVPPIDAGSSVPVFPRGPLGPFAQLSECLHRGNVGVDTGEWPDYECVGGPGNWNVKPLPR